MKCDTLLACNMRLYHNPRCSKSRQALSILNELDCVFEEYRYLDEGIHSDDIAILCKLDGILRMNDLQPEFDFEISDENSVAELLLQHPKLLQRPILIANGKAVIGRPPEKILTLLHDS